MTQEPAIPPIILQPYYTLEFFTEVMAVFHTERYVCSNGQELLIGEIPRGSQPPEHWSVEAISPPFGSAMIWFIKGDPRYLWRRPEVNFHDAWPLPGESRSRTPIGPPLLELRSALSLMLQSAIKVVTDGTWTAHIMGDDVVYVETIVPGARAEPDDDTKKPKPKLVPSRVLDEYKDKFLARADRLAAARSKRSTSSPDEGAGAEMPPDMGESPPPDCPRLEAATEVAVAKEDQFPPDFPQLPAARKRLKEAYRVCRDLRKEYHRLWDEGETLRREPGVREYQDALEAKGMHPYKERRLRDTLKWGDEGLFDKLG